MFFQKILNVFFVLKMICFDYWGLAQTNIRLLTVADKLGAYKNDILCHWENSTEQKNLMLTYAEDNLIFTP